MQHLMEHHFGEPVSFRAYTWEEVQARASAEFGTCGRCKQGIYAVPQKNMTQVIAATKASGRKEDISGIYCDCFQAIGEGWIGEQGLLMAAWQENLEQKHVDKAQEWIRMIPWSAMKYNSPRVNYPAGGKLTLFVNGKETHWPWAQFELSVNYDKHASPQALLAQFGQMSNLAQIHWAAHYNGLSL